MRITAGWGSIKHPNGDTNFRVPVFLRVFIFGRIFSMGLPLANSSTGLSSRRIFDILYPDPADDSICFGLGAPFVLCFGRQERIYLCKGHGKYGFAFYGSLSPSDGEYPDNGH